MTSSIRYAKIFFTLLMLLAFGHSTFADTFVVNLNQEATSTQKSCVFDLDMSYILQDQDTDSAEVDIQSKDTNAIFNKTIPLSIIDGFATASTTVSYALPSIDQKSASFYFVAKLYTGRTDGAVGKLVKTDTATVSCTNPEYLKQQEVLAQAQAQKTSTLFAAIPQNGGSSIQYGNRSFNIGGIGSALSGCLGVGDKIGSLFATGSETSIIVNDSKANKKESCGDSLAYAASRIVIQNLTKQSINLATTGNNGNPYYPTDYKSLYSNIKSDQVKTFITELQSAETSNPYSNAFAKSLAAKARSDSQSFTDKYKYTGPSADFFKEKGGFNWNDWFKYLQPQNNSLGYSQIATQQIKKLEDQAVQTTKEELSNNNGFLSQKTCDDKNFNAWVNDAEQAKNMAAAAKGDKAAMVRVGQSVCKNFKVSTPGFVIATQLSQALGTPLRQAEQVDEIDEGVGLIFDKMISKLVTKGLKSLSSTDFKNNVDFSYNAPTQNTGYELPTGGSFWDEYKTTFDMRRDLPGVIKTQKAYVAQVRKNNDNIALVLKSIDNMDNALPGPYIGWAEGMQQRILETASNIKREAQLYMGGILGNLTTLGMRDKILDGLEGLFIKTFNAVFDFYQSAVANKFDPNLTGVDPRVRGAMPKNSITMIGLIGSRTAYQETYMENSAEITKTDDVILQLEDIDRKVKALYVRACARFIKENPGAKCTP